MNNTKKIIRNKIKAYCKELGIPNCPIKWDNRAWYRQQICFSYDKNNLNDYHIVIGIDKIKEYITINNIGNKTLWHIIPLNSVNKRLNYILGHEIGHYFHFVKYPKWTNRIKITRSNKCNSLDRAKDYRKQRHEQVADKIAFYLTRD